MKQINTNHAMRTVQVQTLSLHKSYVQQPINYKIQAKWPV